MGKALCFRLDWQFYKGEKRVPASRSSSESQPHHGAMSLARWYWDRQCGPRSLATSFLPLLPPHALGLFVALTGSLCSLVLPFTFLSVLTDQQSCLADYQSLIPCGLPALVFWYPRHWPGNCSRRKFIPPQSKFLGEKNT